MAKKKKEEPKWVLVYPVKNKALRFFGDVMLLIGGWFTTTGLKYGGIYMLEDEID